MRAGPESSSPPTISTPCADDSSSHAAAIVEDEHLSSPISCCAQNRWVPSCLELQPAHSSSTCQHAYRRITDSCPTSDACLLPRPSSLESRKGAGSATGRRGRYREPWERTIVTRGSSKSRPRPPLHALDSATVHGYTASGGVTPALPHPETQHSSSHRARTREPP